MAYVAKSFIRDASADADGTAGTIAEDVQNYLSSTVTPGGSEGAREIKVTCTTLSGDRIFCLVSVET